MRFFFGVVLFLLPLFIAPRAVSEPFGWPRLAGSVISLFVGLCLLFGSDQEKKES